jgi:hypothetical protein
MAPPSKSILTYSIRLAKRRTFLSQCHSIERPELKMFFSLVVMPVLPVIIHGEDPYKKDGRVSGRYGIAC